MYKSYFKRPIDIIISAIGLIILSPIILILIIVLTINNNGLPFFVHERPGKNEKIFRLLKFKSMNDKKDKEGYLLPYHLRVTKVGNFIRKTSLDEIPQLFNVLIGDMSIIGPRPLLIEYLERYSDFEKRRHNFRPGITGWAQVNGRNSITWKKKFELDVWYVNNVSFALDLKIVLLTIKKVVLKENINLSENVNMTPFMGND
ncbi:sugar transferase [Gelidibacter salicanalis]|uniref:Sugar transferase n=1 Tax=Gelidibacter salicanalis TaxID=291193 RepID=A0A934KWQ4_9FLAO|nr:sugar transferase [Gelidibacter salicanalis]MBJ7882701.1 sugar transferase [Gelidibacter salicanalis]